MHLRLFSGHTIGQKYHDDPRGCQDYALHWSDVETQRALIVVCDGAGEAKHSHRASKLIAWSIRDFFVVNAGVKWLVDESVENIKFNHLMPALKQAFVKLVNEVRAEDDSVQTKDLGTTLLFVYTDRKQGIAISGHIGDGYILRIEQDAVEFQSEPENGEQAHETYFVPVALQNPNHFRIRRTPLTDRMVGFVCMSDGLDCLIYTRKVLVDYYQMKHSRNVVFHPDLITMFTLENPDVATVLKEQFTEKPLSSGAFRSDDDCGMSTMRFMDIPLNLTSAEEGRKLQQVLEYEKSAKMHAHQRNLEQRRKEIRDVIANIQSTLKEYDDLKSSRLLQGVEGEIRSIDDRLDSTTDELRLQQNLNTVKGIAKTLRGDLQSVRHKQKVRRHSQTKKSGSQSSGHEGRQSTKRTNETKASSSAKPVSSSRKKFSLWKFFAGCALFLFLLIAAIVYTIL